MKPPARAVVGHLIWSADGGVWALWRVAPFPHAHTGLGDKLAVHSRLRGLLLSLPPQAMLLSICERLDADGVVGDMAAGIDLEAHPSWSDACEVTADWLDQVALYRRRYYLGVALPGTSSPWRELLRGAFSEVTAAFGVGPSPVSDEEVEVRQRQARELEARLAANVPLSPVTAGEVCWLYARAMRREAGEPPLDELWEPSDRILDEAGVGDPAGRPGRRLRGVLAHLTEAIVTEGGSKDDEDRPRHRRYVRIDGTSDTSYQTVLAMADMPHFFRFPDGTGEWLYFADHVGFPVDWCVRVRAVHNADAQGRVRRKHRELIGQVDEYGGETSGAPPQLAEAIQALDAERAALGANPMEPEIQATVLFSVAASNLPDLEAKAGALNALFMPQEYGLGRPTGGQAALLRSMLPGTAAATVCQDYTQYMLSRDLAAGSPYCGPDVGDPAGVLLGLSLDGGTGTPVLFDPAYGPKVNTSPSLAAVGRLGSGKSYLLKRLCWDTVARDGQVVTIDRTVSGEYVRFAKVIPGDVQVVRLDAGADVCLDPLRTFHDDDRVTFTLGFLSLLAGCSAHSADGAALAEAVDAVATRSDAQLSDVLTELERMGADARHPDQGAQGLARRLAHYRRSTIGHLAFGSGEALRLEADFIVFWLPNLALPDREMLANEHRSRMMLPEQILGQALLYLVAAIGREVVFRNPSRFAAALYDEAWALLASPYGQNLVIEGVRDGRKHNGAIWLASQHPNDFAISELEDLLGSRFVFRQARQAIPAALRFLGVAGSVDAATTLEHGLDDGHCLFRDVRERVGLIQILPPALPEVAQALETAPTAAVHRTAVGEPVDVLDDANGLGAAEVPQALIEAGEGEVIARGLGAGPSQGRVLDVAETVSAVAVPLSGPEGPDEPDVPRLDPARERLDEAAVARARVRARRRTPLAAALQARSTK